VSALGNHQDFLAARPLRPREDRKNVALRGWFVRPLDQSVWDFCITDLSYSGCRIETAAPLNRGEQVRLGVQKLGNIAATVCWRRNGFVGLAFTEVQPKPQHWPRKSDRHPFESVVLVRRPGRRSQMIDARDIARHGCRLSFVDAPAVGEHLWVRLPGLEPIDAEVRWVRDFECGVSFETPIHEAVFALVLTRAGHNQDLPPESALLRM